MLPSKFLFEGLSPVDATVHANRLLDSVSELDDSEAYDALVESIGEHIRLLHAQLERSDDRAAEIRGRLAAYRDVQGFTTQLVERASTVIKERE